MSLLPARGAGTVHVIQVRSPMNMKFDKHSIGGTLGTCVPTKFYAGVSAPTKCYSGRHIIQAFGLSNSEEVTHVA